MLSVYFFKKMIEKKREEQKNTFLQSSFMWFHKIYNNVRDFKN